MTFNTQFGVGYGSGRVFVGGLHFLNFRNHDVEEELKFFSGEDTLSAMRSFSSVIIEMPTQPYDSLQSTAVRIFAF